MSPFARRCAQLLLWPLSLVAGLLAALGILASILPDPLWIKAAAAAVAAALGWLQSRWLLEAAPPNDGLRVPIRLFFVVAWMGFSQHAAGRFLDATAGGGFRAELKGNLRALRAAVDAYHAEHRGAYPLQLEGLVVSSATVALPTAWTGRSRYAHGLVPHPPGAGVEYYGNEACRGSISARFSLYSLRDTGRWGYVNDPKSSCWGQVFVDCTHLDFSGRPWASY